MKLQLIHHVRPVFEVARQLLINDLNLAPRYLRFSSAGRLLTPPCMYRAMYHPGQRRFPLASKHLLGLCDTLYFKVFTEALKDKPWCKTKGWSRFVYGLIGKITAVSGRRDDLISVLNKGIEAMPGCLSYIIAKDPADDKILWITEVWESEQSHQASLALPSVRQAIEQGRPLIAHFGSSTVTEPVVGHGLTRA